MPAQPDPKLTVGSLFAGIGGFDLGLERAGFEIRWQVEIDPFCRAVLEKHWPAARRFADVRGVHAKVLCEHAIQHGYESQCNTCLPYVDVLCGGFPCQPVSLPGKQRGRDDERWLWPEFRRLIRELRPRYVLVENVPGLLIRELGDVLGDLAQSGFDAEWDVLGAGDFGASQNRERVWILAYTHNSGLQGPIWAGQPYPPRQERQAPHSEPLRSTGGFWPPGPRAVANIPRMADGPADRAHRLKALGNTIVPQIAEWLGRQILEAERLIR